MSGIPHRHLPAVLVLGLLFAACRGGDGSSSAGVTSTPQPSPGDVLLGSIGRFDAVKSYALQFDATAAVAGATGTSQGETAIQSGHVVYSRMSISSGQPPKETGEFLFIPEDLYLRRAGDNWYVLSPWNQGIRPSELPKHGLDDPIVDYDRLVRGMSKIERLGDRTLDGRTYERYFGTASPDDVQSLAPAGAKGSASVEVWLDADSHLPRKVLVRIDLAETGISEDTDLEFVHYNEPATPPERPVGALPYRDLMFPNAPCTGSAFAGCLPAQAGLQQVSSSSCKGGGRRVCVLPLGQVSPGLVQQLVAYYQQQYGLAVTVLTPAAVPAEMANALRQQVDAGSLMDYMCSLFAADCNDPNAVMIGLTPLDLYDQTSHFRYVFGVKATFSNPKAVISSLRMLPQFYSEAPDETRFFTRMRTLLSKYIGLLYYGLPPSSDPQSAMYDSILGPEDLDGMTKPLPVPRATP